MIWMTSINRNLIEVECMCSIQCIDAPLVNDCSINLFPWIFSLSGVSSVINNPVFKDNTFGRNQIRSASIVPSLESV